MAAVIWLLIGLAAGAGAVLVGMPAWRQVRARETRDLNVERYRAWRGHSARTAGSRPREGMTADERRRLAIAATLAVVAVVGVVAFFVAS